MGQFFSAKKIPKANDSDSLTLYYHPFSYYSQKVLFVLHEKNIQCSLHEVDVTNGEQCSNWFLQLNPKLDVPVLQNGTFVVPSSGQIINYLETTFDDDKHVALLPKAEKKLRQKVINFHRRISQIPIGLLSLGSFIHVDIVHNSKLPFVGPLRDGFLKSEAEMISKLEKYAANNPIYKDALLAKARLQKEKHNIIRKPEEFEKLINAVSRVLDDVEIELEHQFNDSNEWLCCNEFTIADISLGLTLHRLSILGLESYFWADGKKPFLAKYYRRIRERESFQQSLPSASATMKIVWYKLPVAYKYYTLGIAAIIVGITVYQI